MNHEHAMILGMKTGVAASLPLPRADSKRQVAAPAGLAPCAPAALAPLKVVDLVTPHLPVVLARIVAGYVPVRTPAEFGLQAILDVLRKKGGETAQLQAMLHETLRAFEAFPDSPRGDSRLQRALDDLSGLTPQLIEIIPDCAAILGVVFHVAERQPLEVIPAWPEAVRELSRLALRQVSESADPHAKVISQLLDQIIALEDGPQLFEKIEDLIASQRHAFSRIHLSTRIDPSQDFRPQQILESMVPRVHVDGYDEAARLSMGWWAMHQRQFDTNPLALVASELFASSCSGEECVDGQQLDELRDALDDARQAYQEPPVGDWPAVLEAIEAVRSCYAGAILYALRTAAEPAKTEYTHSPAVSSFKRIKEIDQEISAPGPFKDCLRRARKLAREPQTRLMTSYETSEFVSHAIRSLAHKLFGEHRDERVSGRTSIELLQCLVDAIALAEPQHGSLRLDSKIGAGARATALQDGHVPEKRALRPSKEQRKKESKTAESSPLRFEVSKDGAAQGGEVGTLAHMAHPFAKDQRHVVQFLYDIIAILERDPSNPPLVRLQSGDAELDGIFDKKPKEFIGVLYGNEERCLYIQTPTPIPKLEELHHVAKGSLRGEWMYGGYYRKQPDRMKHKYRVPLTMLACDAATLLRLRDKLVADRSK